ncbi:MAG: 23S rRNA (adenine(2503)-C(2))-methyltransferase RlmN [Verrucomicrobiota bacterium]
MVSIYDINGAEELRRRNAVQPHRMRLFRNALFKNFGGREAALAALPEGAREDFDRSIEFECLELIEQHDSEIDGASKLVFKTADNYLVESVVLRPATGRTSLCISSQVGCACSCAFCATGQMGFMRNLTAGEILDQVAQAGRLVKPEGRSIRNVVFMGMGEPLLNLENLFQALGFLLAVEFFNLPGSRITVSTVGIPHAMERFVEQFPAVQLALSLHSARQEVREGLMPMAGRYPLELLRETLERTSGSGKVMIEYLMLDGVNDGEADLQALVDFLSGIPAHINIIPFNGYEGCDLNGTPGPKRERFTGKLKELGFDVTLRYSLGSDISAACGQLVRKIERI